jgi:RNA polymerase sigma factor FliA
MTTPPIRRRKTATAWWSGICMKYQAEHVAANLPDDAPSAGDLIQEGVFGLMDAIEGFDTGRGIKFETYCVPRIRGAMIDHMRRTDWVPRLVRSRSKKVTGARDAFYNREGRAPDDDELAAELGLGDDAESFDRTMRDSTAVKMGSLQASTHETDSGRKAEAVLLLDDERAEQPDARAEAGEVFLLLMQSLSADERTLIRLYYVEHCTFKRIGEALNISESRVSQMHGGIMRHLRRRCADHFGKRDALDMLFREHVLYAGGEDDA